MKPDDSTVQTETQSVGSRSRGESMTKTVWLSYHIGIRGDYEGLYVWLDSKEAKECGDGLVVFKYETADGDVAESLKVEIDEAVENASKMRIYVVFRDEETGRNKGKFLFGRRKAPPWAGYNGLKDQDDDDEE